MQTPASYVCEKCGVHGVKLWRPAHGFRLLCRACAEPEQTDAIARYATYARRDTIGDLLPAVPVGDTFWGYSSVPQEGCDWWNALPDKPDPRDTELTRLRSELKAAKLMPTRVRETLRCALSHMWDEYDHENDELCTEAWDWINSRVESAVSNG
jgi:hypothetical protein